MHGCIGNFEPEEPPKPNGGSEPTDVAETADIDLNNWKVTLPIGDPTEIKPPAILNYANIEVLQKYMYDDPLEDAIVFFTEPGSTTTNTSYSRTELREQIVPGSNNFNWTFAQGGNMKGTLRVSRISGAANNLDRTIVMQIHGRLTDAQRELIGASDNNAPPVLKIYWDDGRINVRRKVLKDLNVSDIDLLKKDAWEDDSQWFSKEVGNDQFSLEVDVNAEKMSVTLVGEETITFNDIHIEKWGVFENYFKAGNYLQTSNQGAFSEVKYFALEVKH